MKTLEIFKKIILENVSKIEFLLDKYTKEQKNKEGKKIKPLLDLTKFAQIVLADPTTKRPADFDESDMSLKNISKLVPGGYSNWLLRTYEKPELDPETAQNVEPGSASYKQVLQDARDFFMEDLFKVTDDLKKFTKYKQYFPIEQRDIQKFKSPNELFRFLDSFQLPEKKKKELEKKELKKEIRKEREGFSHPGATIEVVGDRYTVIKISDCGPKGQEAASWYGGFYDYANGESRWCTSPPNSSYFKGYCKDGPLYVLLANEDNGKVGQRTGLPQERFQFHFPSNQFMDRADQRIDLINFLMQNAPDLKEYFKPEFARGLTTAGGKKLEIEYPSSAAAKFIALYGFEDFFTSLPENLESFCFTNKSTEQQMSLDIPPTITRFKDLSALMLQNCVKSLPKEIGQLKKLNFISLQNTPQLQSIPDSILDLPELFFINLSGTNPNVKLPARFKDMFEEEEGFEGSGFFNRKGQ